MRGERILLNCGLLLESFLVPMLADKRLWQLVELRSPFEGKPPKSGTSEKLPIGLRPLEEMGVVGVLMSTGCVVVLGERNRLGCEYMFISEVYFFSGDMCGNRLVVMSTGERGALVLLVRKGLCSGLGRLSCAMKPWFSAGMESERGIVL